MRLVCLASYGSAAVDLSTACILTLEMSQRSDLLLEKKIIKKSIMWKGVWPQEELEWSMMIVATINFEGSKFTKMDEKSRIASLWHFPSKNAHLLMTFV